MSIPQNPARTTRSLRFVAITLLVAAAIAAVSVVYAAPGDHIASFGWDAMGVAASAPLGAAATAGTFSGTVDFGGGPEIAVNTVRGDVFIAHYTPGYDWSHTFTPTGDGAKAIRAVVDPSGAIYVAGEITGTVDFGGGPIGGTAEIFLAKFDPNGNHLWSSSYGRGFVADLATSSAGVAITGSYSTTLDFGGGPLVNIGGFDCYVAVLDPTGAHVWSASFGDAQSQYGKCLVLGENGGVGLSGMMAGTVDFGGGPLVASFDDLFIARFTSAGNHLWSQNFLVGFGSAPLVETDLALGPDNEFILCGTLLGIADFGGGNLNAIGGGDAFLAVYDQNGVYVSSQLVGGDGYDAGQSVQIDAAGNTILTGTFESTADFGDGDVTAAGSSDLFVASWSSSGTPLWSRTFGTTLLDDRCEASTDDLGNVVLFGSATNGIDVGGGPLADAGFWVARLEAFSTMVGAPTSPLESAVTAARCFPNPFRGSTTIRFTNSWGGDAVVTLHDVTGRMIRTYAERSPSSSEATTIAWDGRDDAGRSVPAGVYFYRVVRPDRVEGGRIVRLR